MSKSHFRPHFITIVSLRTWPAQRAAALGQRRKESSMRGGLSRRPTRRTRSSSDGWAHEKDLASRRAGVRRCSPAPSLSTYNSDTGVGGRNGNEARGHRKCSRAANTLLRRWWHTCPHRRHLRPVAPCATSNSPPLPCWRPASHQYRQCHRIGVHRRWQVKKDLWGRERRGEGGDMGPQCNFFYF